MLIIDPAEFPEPHTTGYDCGCDCDRCRQRHDPRHQALLEQLDHEMIMALDNGDCHMFRVMENRVVKAMRTGNEQFRATPRKKPTQVGAPLAHTGRSSNFVNSGDVRGAPRADHT